MIFMWMITDLLYFMIYFFFYDLSFLFVLEFFGHGLRIPLPILWGFFWFFQLFMGFTKELTQEFAY